MRLNEVNYDDRQPVEGYGPGFFRIGGNVYEGPTLVYPSGVTAWGGYDDVDALLSRRDEVDFVFIGTGAETAHPPAGFREKMELEGIAIDPMSSPAACRTYNVLLSEGRRVALALIPI